MTPDPQIMLAFEIIGITLCFVMGWIAVMCLIGFVIEYTFRRVQHWAHFMDTLQIHVRQGRAAAKAFRFNQELQRLNAKHVLGERDSRAVSTQTTPA